MSFKKICVVITGLFVCCATGFSQNNQQAKDSLLKLMSVQVCDEISKINSADLSVESLENAIMMSMMPLITTHQAALEQIMDVNVSDPKSFERFGNELGLELLKSCAAFRDVAMGRTGNSDAGTTASDAATNISGKLLKVQTGAMNSVELMNAEGKVLTIWCTRHFAGDEKLTDLNHIGKQIQVEYVTEKVYDFVTGGYREIMVARGISGL
jgi:hypothetical protein